LGYLDKSILKKTQNIPENGSIYVSMSLGMNGTIHLPILDLPPMYDNAIIYFFLKYKK
jgi:hypothetical protein